MRIPPTVGRVLHFYPADPKAAGVEPGTPLCALIAGVLPPADGNKDYVNLAVFSWKGHAGAARNVPLLQEGDTRPERGEFAEWMPYQKGQAAKTEATEGALRSALQGGAAGGDRGAAPASSLATTEAMSAAVAVAPRVALADIEAAIGARYDMTADKAIGPEVPAVNSLRLLSICILVMQNGFTVIGKSAPASPENFNAYLGRQYAYEDAIRQVWPLMGFALRDKLANNTPSVTLPA